MAFSNLALAHLKKGEPLHARAWLYLAADTDAADKATLFNRGEVDKAIAALPSRPAIGGTYLSYVGAGQWNSIELKAKGKDQYELKLFAMRLGNSWREWGPAGIGELDGETLTVKGNQAKYKNKFEYAEEACEIDFKFAGDEMEVDQASPTSPAASVTRSPPPAITTGSSRRLREPPPRGWPPRSGRPIRRCRPSGP